MVRGSARSGALAALAILALGCGSGGTSGGGGPATGVAVMTTDFMSTSISLLANDGTLVKDDCIDSGTSASGSLSLALSGDVTLPSQPQQGGGLWLIDSGNAAVMLLDPTTCGVRQQVSVATGFKSNPKDVAVVSDTKVYVTRYETNGQPPDAMSKGDDIVILDRASGALTGRIDLSAYAVVVPGAAIQARPDRMMLIDGRVYVTLGNADSMFATAGEGSLVTINADTDKVIDAEIITGLKDCSAMFFLEETKTLFVACGGSFADADQAAGSGIAEFNLNGDPPKLTRITKASTFGGPPVTFFWVAAASPTRGFTTVIGSLPDAAHNVAGTNDAAFAFDPAAGAATPIGLETGPFDMGRGVLDGGLLLVPDATATKPLVHVFDVSGAGAPVEKTSFDPGPARGLPPHELARY
jgi:hypothetical protein